MAVIRIPEEKFDDKRPVSEKVYEDQNARVVRFYLKSGQEIRPHTSPSSVFITLLSGKAIFLNQDGEVTALAGTTLFYEPGELHGFRALEDSVFEAVIAPPPSTSKVNISQT